MDKSTTGFDINTAKETTMTFQFAAKLLSFAIGSTYFSPLVTWNNVDITKSSRIRNSVNHCTKREIFLFAYKPTRKCKYHISLLNLRNIIIDLTKCLTHRPDLIPNSRGVATKRAVTVWGPLIVLYTGRCWWDREDLASGGGESDVLSLPENIGFADDVMAHFYSSFDARLTLFYNRRYRNFDHINNIQACYAPLVVYFLTPPRGDL
ncbi:unnamed protein product [Clavelina lepadiformis]|uniref:Uncharacterized protein n=1 Tax=Clavelina lepadiformis TaxID=159417 RepID=A0ABP0FU14_CLALP